MFASKAARVRTRRSRSLVLGPVLLPAFAVLVLLASPAGAELDARATERMSGEQDIGKGHGSLEDRIRSVLNDGEDRFTWLSAEAKSELATDDGSSIAAKIHSLHEFEAPTMIDVQLVGFEGEGNGGIEYVKGVDGGEGRREGVRGPVSRLCTCSGESVQLGHDVVTCICARAIPERASRRAYV